MSSLKIENFFYRLIIMKPRLMFYTDRTYTKMRSNKFIKIDKLWFKISFSLWEKIFRR